MLFPGEVLHKYVDEGNEKIENYETACETVLYAVYGHKFPDECEGRELLMARKAEYQVYDHCIERDLKIEFQKLLPRESGGAHEIPRDQYEAVDACLSPCSEKHHCHGGGG